MNEENFQYDVFLSHAGEDTAWCEALAKRLRNEGVRVWFDKWELQPGDPMLIPLKDVRKENSLESMIISHFSKAGLPGINFSRFEHLIRVGKVILLFDAFDEMADRLRWEVTKGNFTEPRRRGKWQSSAHLPHALFQRSRRARQAYRRGPAPFGN